MWTGREARPGARPFSAGPGLQASRRLREPSSTLCVCWLGRRQVQEPQTNFRQAGADGVVAGTAESQLWQLQLAGCGQQWLMKRRRDRAAPSVTSRALMLGPARPVAWPLGAAPLPARTVHDIGCRTWAALQRAHSSLSSLHRALEASTRQPASSMTTEQASGCQVAIRAIRGACCMPRCYRRTPAAPSTAATGEAD